MDSATPPQVPDPVVTANAQGAANNDAARLTAQLNRANQYTPWGNLIWNQGPKTFDQTGYDAAMAAYNGQGSGTGNASTEGGGAQGDNFSSGGQGGSKGTAPDKNSFYSGGDDWSSTITLNPQLQALLDAQMKTSQGLTGTIDKALGNAQNVLGKPIDYSSLPKAGNAADTWTAMMNLMQDGMTPGSTLGFDSGANSSSGIAPNKVGEVNYNPHTLADYQVGDLQYDLPKVQQNTGTMTSNAGNIQGQQGLNQQSQALLSQQMGKVGNLGNMPMPSEAVRKQVEDALYQRETSRLDPRFTETEDQMRSTLMNRGIVEGSEAWNNELANFNRSKNDAYSTATWDSIVKGGEEQKRLFDMILGGRDQTLEEMLGASSVNQGTGNTLSQMLAGETSQYGAKTAQQQADTALMGTTGNLQLGEYNAENAAKQGKYNSDIDWFKADTGATLAKYLGENSAKTSQFLADTGLFKAEQDVNLNAYEAENRARALQQGLDINKTNSNVANTGSAFNMQNQERGNALNEQERLRAMVLNELASLRSGAQVGQPQFGQTPSGANVNPAPVAQSAWNAYQGQQGQYQADVGSSNAQMGQMAQIAGMLAMMFSDRRLKRNIKRIGTHSLGIGLYSFEYIWGEAAVGVMADEVRKVRPEAVHQHSSGYDMVDYSNLGV